MCSSDLLRLALVTCATALVPPLVLLACAGLGAGLVLGLHDGDVLDRLQRLVPAAIAPWPASAVVVALALLGWAWGGRGAAVGWTVLGLAVVLGEIGPLLDLPDAVLAVSPFHHVPQAPGESPWSLAQAVMLVIAVALSALAARRFSRRDLG